MVNDKWSAEVNRTDAGSRVSSAPCAQAEPARGPGYHFRPIVKGTNGELSKLWEELHELADAEAQGVSVMVLLELADLYGAMKLYLEKHYPTMSMTDIALMSHATGRAFINGQR